MAWSGRVRAISPVSAIICARRQTKLIAVRADRSQVDKFTYDEAVEGLNRFRGAQAARCRYAETYGQLGPIDHTQVPPALRPGSTRPSRS